MNFDPLKSDEFLARLISNQLSESERRDLSNWRIANPAGSEELDQLMAVWQDSAELELDSGQAGEERWSRLSQEINSQPNTKQKSLPRRALALAATLLLLATAAYLLLRPSDIREYVPAGAEARTFFLPDDSRVILSADSEISYNPEGWETERKLTMRGEAYFDVIPSSATFTVTTSLATIEVEGTTFNVREREDQIKVFCETGVVKVTNTDNPENQLQLFASRFTNRSKESAFHRPLTAPSTENVLSWRAGEFHFTSTPLIKVIREVERQFDVEVSLPEALHKEAFTGTFSRGNIETVIRILSLSSGLQYEIKGRKVRIFKK